MKNKLKWFHIDVKKPTERTVGMKAKNKTEVIKNMMSEMKRWLIITEDDDDIY